MTPNTNIPDSGTRAKFITGAVRDAAPGKGLPCQIPPVALRLLALKYETGGQKYGMGNWRQGIPLSRFYDAIFRHSLKAAEGCTDEDHIGAVLWNAAGWAWTAEQIEKGLLPAELNDLPYFR